MSVKSVANSCYDMNAHMLAVATKPSEEHEQQSLIIGVKDMFYDMLTVTDWITSQVQRVPSRGILVWDPFKRQIPTISKWELRIHAPIPAGLVTLECYSCSEFGHIQKLWGKILCDSELNDKMMQFCSYKQKWKNGCKEINPILLPLLDPLLDLGVEGWELHHPLTHLKASEQTKSFWNCLRKN